MKKRQREKNRGNGKEKMKEKSSQNREKGKLSFILFVCSLNIMTGALDSEDINILRQGESKAITFSGSKFKKNEIMFTNCIFLHYGELCHKSYMY